MVTFTVSAAQADRIAHLIDQEVAANKNRLVSATLSTGDYHNEAGRLATIITNDIQIRANMRRQGVK